MSEGLRLPPGTLSTPLAAIYLGEFLDGPLKDKPGAIAAYQQAASSGHREWGPAAAILRAHHPARCRRSLRRVRGHRPELQPGSGRQGDQGLRGHHLRSGPGLACGMSAGDPGLGNACLNTHR